MPKKVTFKFIRAPGVTVQPISGYWLVDTPAGFLLDLFYQRPATVSSVTHAVNPADNSIGEEVSREVSAEHVREILASVELSPATALELGKYLVECAQKRLQTVETPTAVH